MRESETQFVSGPGESVGDYLQFEGGVLELDPAARGGMRRFGWRGAWPPPELLSVALGLESRMVSVFDEEEAAAESVAELGRLCEITRFRRVSHSMLPPQSEASHVARGALYRPDQGQGGE